MGLIGQLEAIGGLEEWALYVAQHLPDGPAPEWRGLRDQLVCPDACSRAIHPMWPRGGLHFCEKEEGRYGVLQSWCTDSK